MFKYELGEDSLCFDENPGLPLRNDYQRQCGREKESLR
jgi:hypothetical protein